MQSVAAEISGKLQELEHLLPSIEPTKCPAIIGALEQLKAMAWVVMSKVPTRATDPGQARVRERYLSVAEVCERFHVTRKWLYRHKGKLPHSQPTRKTLLFPEMAIQQWFANRHTA